jgi:hypothetical protein
VRALYPRLLRALANGEDYLRTTLEVSSLSRCRVLAQVAAQPGCSLENLFRATDGEVSRDEVYALIAAGDIYVDLQSVLLPEPERVSLWLEKSHAGALPQAQGSSRNRRKLLHLAMEPSDSLLGSFSHVYKSFCLYTNTGARDFWQSVPCKETSAPSAERWFKARNWQRSANLKDL